MKIGKLGEIYFERKQFFDARGSLTKIFNVSSFRLSGVDFEPKEIFYSISTQGAIRGVHSPIAKKEFWRMICVLDGKIDDVLIDLRGNSKTKGNIVRNELDISSPFVLIPMGVCHGFQCVSRNSQMLYVFGHEYLDTCERGINILSSCFKWDLEVTAISDKDKILPYYDV